MEIPIDNESHNHNASQNPTAHPYIRKADYCLLKGHKAVRDGVNADLPNRRILATHLQTNPTSTVIKKDIANQNAWMRRAELQNRTPLKALIKRLENDGNIQIRVRLTNDKRLT